MRSLNILILLGTRIKCLRSGRSQSLYLSLINVIKQNVGIIEEYHLGQSSTNIYPKFCGED
jgi:hypothetical protein